MSRILAMQKLRSVLEPWTQKKSVRAAAAFVTVGICTAALAITVVGVTGSVSRADAAGRRDYVAYWASGQQLAHHADPYDGNAILNIERSANYAGYPALIMRNPPTALLLAYPLGFVSARAGELLWSALLVACLGVSVRMVWVLHGRPNSKIHLLGYTFGPALVCVVAGQMSLIILLGLAGFLRWHRSRPFLAGLMLWFCLLKPHLFLPFIAALVAWAIFSRAYRVLAGTALSLAVSAAAAQLPDLHVWLHYFQMLRADHVDQTVIACLSILLRRTINPEASWLQYLPAALGCAWAIVYLRRHRDDWQWLDHGSLLMLVSFVVAPYAWLTDQAVLIPALLHAAYLNRSRSLLGVLALASAAIELGILGGAQPFHSLFYTWTAPGWLAWYLYAVHTAPAQTSLTSAEPVVANDIYLPA